MVRLLRFARSVDGEDVDPSTPIGRDGHGEVTGGRAEWIDEWTLTAEWRQCIRHSTAPAAGHATRRTAAIGCTHTNSQSATT